MSEANKLQSAAPEVNTVEVLEGSRCRTKSRGLVSPAFTVTVFDSNGRYPVTRAVKK
jgi:hypothetical protein